MVDFHLLYYTRKAKYFRVKVLSDRNDKFLKEFKLLNYDYIICSWLTYSIC